MYEPLCSYSDHSIAISEFGVWRGSKCLDSYLGRVTQNEKSMIYCLSYKCLFLSVNCRRLVLALVRRFSSYHTYLLYMFSALLSAFR